MVQDTIFTVTQAARRAGITRDAVRKWIHSGRLAADRDAAGRYRVRESDLLAAATPRSGRGRPRRGDPHV